MYSLQKLMGHADLQVLRQYLAQTNEDLRVAHERFSPVERMGMWEIVKRIFSVKHR